MWPSLVVDVDHTLHSMFLGETGSLSAFDNVRGPGVASVARAALGINANHTVPRMLLAARRRLVAWNCEVRLCGADWIWTPHHDCPGQSATCDGNNGKEEARIKCNSLYQAREIDIVDTYGLRRALHCIVEYLVAFNNDETWACCKPEYHLDTDWQDLHSGLHVEHDDLKTSSRKRTSGWKRNKKLKSHIQKNTENFSTGVLVTLELYIWYLAQLAGDESAETGSIGSLSYCIWTQRPSKTPQRAASRKQVHCSRVWAESQRGLKHKDQGFDDVSEWSLSRLL